MVMPRKGSMKVPLAPTAASASLENERSRVFAADPMFFVSAGFGIPKRVSGPQCALFTPNVTGSM